MKYPKIARVLNLPELKQIRNIRFFTGGFGSSLAFNPQEEDCFYFLSDRGPVAKGDGKVCFVNPEHCPAIGKFRLKGEELVLEKLIELKNEKGEKLNGLPRPENQGDTGEDIYDLDQNPIQKSLKGIDPEGLTILKDGSFWISEEYEPAIAHFDAAGRMIDKISPFTPGKTLPKVLARRQPNRGFEGITHSPDEKKIIAIMQTTLQNPDEKVQDNSRLCRLVVYYPDTQTTEEYAYMLEEPGLSCSEISVINEREFLVIERDHEKAAQAKYKRVYKINISEASNITDPEDKAGGLTFEGKTLEQMDKKELNAHQIRPVKKELLVDLLSLNYPHEKPEGVVMINKNLIAVSNDDDFAIKGDLESGLKQKFREGQQIAFTEIYFIEV